MARVKSSLVKKYFNIGLLLILIGGSFSYLGPSVGPLAVQPVQAASACGTNPFSNGDTGTVDTRITRPNGVYFSGDVFAVYVKVPLKAGVKTDYQNCSYRLYLEMVLSEIHPLGVTYRLWTRNAVTAAPTTDSAGKVNGWEARWNLSGVKEELLASFRDGLVNNSQLSKADLMNDTYLAKAITRGGGTTHTATFNFYLGDGTSGFDESSTASKGMAIIYYWPADGENPSAKKIDQTPQTIPEVSNTKVTNNPTGGSWTVSKLFVQLSGTVTEYSIAPGDELWIKYRMDWGGQDPNNSPLYGDTISVSDYTGTLMGFYGAVGYGGGTSSTKLTCNQKLVGFACDMGALAVSDHGGYAGLPAPADKSQFDYVKLPWSRIIDTGGYTSQPEQSPPVTKQFFLSPIVAIFHFPSTSIWSILFPAYGVVSATASLSTLVAPVLGKLTSYVGLGFYPLDTPGGNNATFNVKIFPTQAALIADCVARYKAKNPAADDATAAAKCKDMPDNIFLHETGEAQTVTSNNPTAGGDQNNSLIGSFLTEVAAWIISNLTGVLFFFFGAVIAPLIQAILAIHPYTDSFVNVIYPGWQILRNVSNIFFILGMLLIGLGTILRLEKYNYKHLLVHIILAALLVNFSLVLGQAVLGLADTMQAQFLPANTNVISALAGKLMVEPVTAIYNSGSFTSGGNLGTLVEPFFLLWLALLAFFTFLAIAAFLVVRLIVLWVLLMLSPLAYAAWILPQTEHYLAKWWEEFLKYAFMVPIFAFFLNMAALFASQHFDVVKQAATDANLSAPSDLVFTVAGNLLIMAFIFAGFKVATSIGGYGAAGITSFAQKYAAAPIVVPLRTGAKGAKMGTKALAGFGTEVLHAKTGVQIDPRKWVEGWKKSREINRGRRLASGYLKANNRNSTLANPESFFQRNFNLRALSRVAQGGDRKGRDLFTEAERLRGDAKLNRDKAVTEPNPVTRAHLLDKANEWEETALALETHGRHLLAPTDYETQTHIRGAVAEEKTKIKTESWEELLDLMQTAVHEQNFPRYQAIMEKLAETYNENEAANHMRYLENKIDPDGAKHKAGDFFDQSPQGLLNMYEQYVGGAKGFNLGNRTAHQFLGDVSHVAEQHNHWSIARLMDNKNGEFRPKTQEELENEQGVEKGKVNASRLEGDLNRLGDAYEYVIPGGGRISLMQDNANRRVVNSGTQGQFRIARGQVNESNYQQHVFRPNLYAKLAEIDLLSDELIQNTDDHGKAIGGLVTRKWKAAQVIKAAVDTFGGKWGEGKMAASETGLQKRLDDDSLPRFELAKMEKSGYIKKDAATGKYVIQGKLGDLDDITNRLDSYK